MGPRDEHPLFAAIRRIARAVSGLRDELRKLYYGAVLFGKRCPHCEMLSLQMVRDGLCRCRDCGHAFDPTTQFQSCTECGSPLLLKVCRYWCPKCRRPVDSAYCFDAHVFDQTYFREKMQESRERKRERKERVKSLLAASRSGPHCPDEKPSLKMIAGLESELDAFVGLPIPKEVLARMLGRSDFDMEQYRQHILELVEGCVVRFSGISQLVDDARADRVFRFITVVFMEHQGEVVLSEEAGDIRIRENEAHSKGQGIH